ncbi:hypothetical protein K0M31_006960 [Melipona bicolor]|uniref:Uncharacterized protein n=1 Tax=Melipona bicolor TaxID=60889 RepID=A0AA40FRC1_9HYME|nr:hypothetical protein K0M31_006960 [Melipona bicolor]
MNQIEILTCSNGEENFYETFINTFERMSSPKIDLKRRNSSSGHNNLFWFTNGPTADRVTEEYVHQEIHGIKEQEGSTEKKIFLRVLRAEITARGSRSSFTFDQREIHFTRKLAAARTGRLTVPLPRDLWNEKVPIVPLFEGPRILR